MQTWYLEILTKQHRFPEFLFKDKRVRRGVHLRSKNTIRVFLTLMFASVAASAQPSKIVVGYALGNVIRVVVDSAAHATYGLSYPVTYKLSIPLGSAELAAFRRYSITGAWDTITEKSSEDFFNGEEVVRFDYAASCAYVSVPFGSSSDTVYLKITNTSGQSVAIGYLEVCTYYDNRRAAVTITADDWEPSVDEYFRYALRIFRSYRLWVSAGIITKYPSADSNWNTIGWNSIQQELDSGYVEAGSHSRTHPHVPFADPASEVMGSKEDILGNLNLPALFRNGLQQYMYTWIEPYGEYDAVVDNLISVNHYLVARNTLKGITSFSNWDDTKGRYDPVGVTREMGPSPGGSTNLADLNGAFDAAVAAGGIYHLMCHPWVLSEQGEWDKPYTLEHLSYISNRKDIWYVPMGLLYLYHSVIANISSPGRLLSDGFDGSSLNGVWTFIDPRGDAALTMTGTQVSISIPAGMNHDVWTDGNFAPRIVQTTTNIDFEVETKFDSPMTAGYQMLGIIAEQNASNYLRFDFVYGASMTRIYAASFAGGGVTVRKDSAIANGSPLYLRVKRVGNQWTESFSYDGADWITAVTFTHSLVVGSVGPFVGNYGNPESSAPAFTGLIDYFSAITDTITATVNGPGTITPSGVVALSRWTNQAFTMTPNVGAHIDSVQVDGVRVDSTTSYTFLNVIANHTIDVYFSTRDLLSDEFNAPALDVSLWGFTNPLGDATVAMTGTHVSISIPAGANHDVNTGGNFAPRITQVVRDADFEVTMKFDSPMTAGYQMQGLIAQQDTGNYLRFDFVCGGSMIRIYAASFAGGGVTVRKDSAISNGSPLYLRVKRVGNQWTELFSYNGTTWMTAVSFSYTLVISSVGPFVGNYGSPESSAPAFTGLIDYFRTASITANLKAFLQGPFTTPGDSMRTSLLQQRVLPLQQPYSGVPWNYSGTESVGSIPSGVVDWVLVELRTDTSAVSKVATRAGFIKDNGSIVDIDGVSPVSFGNVAAGNYYVVIRHRNHLAVMSRTAIALNQASGMYDFTTSQGQAYGTSPMRLVGTKYTMYAGDGNQSGIVTAADANAAYVEINTLGYNVDDINLSGIVSATDANIIFANINKMTRVP
jgi:hypothetical protein